MTTETQIIISARDLASQSFKSAGTAVDGLIGRLTNLDVLLAGLGTGLGLGAATQSFGEYQTALTDMAKVTDEAFASIDAKIGDVPDVLGTSAEMVRGYYQVISAGVKDPAKAMDMLTQSARNSKSAHVEQSQVVKALTKLMAGFSGEIASAADASDLLFTIEKEGQTSFAELVPVIGDIASLSKLAGASSEEMGAAMAMITQTAGGTSQAATQYKAVLMGLIKPQEQMRDLLKEMGYASGTALVQQHGLSGALVLLSQSAQAAGIPLGRLFESSEALTALGPLLADGFGKYADVLKEMEKRTGRADKAFQEWQKTQEAAETRARNTVKNFMTDLGEELSPGYMSGLNGISDWFDAHGKDLADDIGTMLDGLREVGSLAAGMVFSVSNAWNNLPDVIKKYGLLPALFGGTSVAKIVAGAMAIKTVVDELYLRMGFEDPQKAIDYANDVILAKRRGGGLGSTGRVPVEQAVPDWTPKTDSGTGGAGTGGNGGGDGGAAAAAAKEAEEYISKVVKAADKQFADLLEKQAALREQFSDGYRRLVLGEHNYELAKLRETADAYIAAGSDKVSVETWVASETARINDEKLRDSRDAFDGMSLAFQDYADEATNMASQMGDLIGDAMTGVEDALVAPFEGAKFEIGNLVDAILSDILRIGIRTSITGPISSMLGDVFSGVFHEGGVAGQGAPGFRSVPASAWAGAPRYHSGGVGGLAPDELAVIVRRGEEILTEDDPRHRNNLPATRSVPASAYAGAAQAGAAPRITLNIHNESGQPIEAQDVDVRFDGEGFVITAWMRAVRENRNGVRDFLRGGGAN